jgi:hypothetical protein
MKGSKGILEGLNFDSKKEKNVNSKEFKKLKIEEESNLKSEEVIKRSYTLKASTIKKLQELKVFVYTDPNITYNEIVDEAINLLYETRK